MHYYFIFLVFFLCNSCQFTETAALTDAPKTPLVDTLSQWDKELLSLSSNAQEDLVAELYLKSLPKLPGDSSFFSALQVNALESGSKKSLHREYQRIITPQNNNAQTKTKHLDLSDQHIHYIPDKVTNYPNLMYLSLKNNHIQAINPKLAHCKNLKKLDLSSNGLQSTPFGLIYLTQLDELVLADNKLSSLPSYLYNLHNLRAIDISNDHTKMAIYYNDIKEVPTVLSKMPHLEKLFLDNLPLRNLPSGMKDMTGLHVLSLTRNNALDFNQAFEVLATLPNLMALDISFIGRRTIPQNIAKLKNLKVLVWHEEKQANQLFILETLKVLLPNTKIYFGEKDVPTPFLRGNSVSTLRGAGY